MDRRGRLCHKSWSVGHRIKDAGVLTRPTPWSRSTRKTGRFAPDGADAPPSLSTPRPCGRGVTSRALFPGSADSDEQPVSLRNTLPVRLRGSIWSAAACSSAIRFGKPVCGASAATGRRGSEHDLDGNHPIRAVMDAHQEMCARAERSKTHDSFVFLGTTWRVGRAASLPTDLRESMPKTWFLALRHPAVTDEYSVESGEERTAKSSMSTGRRISHRRFET